MLILAPVSARNYAVGGEFHVTAANFGDNFYKGNHEATDGLYRPLRPGRGTPRYERQDAVELATRALWPELGRELTPAEVSGYWTGRALEYIRADPWDWVGLMLRKVRLYFNGIEWADSEDLYTHADASWLLGISRYVTHFGVLVPLALLGGIVAWPRRRELWLPAAMAMLYSAGVIAFYVFGRYRHPVAPFLIPVRRRGSVRSTPLLARFRQAHACVDGHHAADRGSLLQLADEEAGSHPVRDRDQPSATRCRRPGGRKMRSVISNVPPLSIRRTSAARITSASRSRRPDAPRRRSVTTSPR